MLRLNYKKYNFAFEHPFVTAKGEKTHQESLIIALQLGQILGLGEATAIPYHNISLDDMIALVEKHRYVIEHYALVGPERFGHFLHHLIPENPFLMSALDMAAWDVWGQMKRQPLWKLFGFEWKNIPATDYTIGINTTNEIDAIVSQHPYSIYKLKLGSENDLPTLESLRSLTDARIRIDANEAWDEATALAIYPHLERLNVELIEQPLHRDDKEGLAALKAISKIPIIADEACQDEEQLQDCLERYDGINIKLSKCGGLTVALNMIATIKKEGKKIMLGGMCENIVGATALAHLLPAADYADIDGPLLLKEHFGKGLIYEGNIISLPNRNGLGLSLH